MVNLRVIKGTSLDGPTVDKFTWLLEFAASTSFSIFLRGKAKDESAFWAESSTTELFLRAFEKQFSDFNLFSRRIVSPALSYSHAYVYAQPNPVEP